MYTQEVDRLKNLLKKQLLHIKEVDGTEYKEIYTRVVVDEDEFISFDMSSSGRWSFRVGMSGDEIGSDLTRLLTFYGSFFDVKFQRLEEKLTLDQNLKFHHSPETYAGEIGIYYRAYKYNWLVDIIACLKKASEEYEALFAE